MMNPTHRQYASKRLSMARQMLSLRSEFMHEENCFDAALMQVYFSMHHYINELLEKYQRPLVEETSFALRDVIFDESGFVSELQECKQLLSNKDSWLSILLSHPQRMLNMASRGAQGTAKTANSTHPEPLQLIAVSDGDNNEQGLASAVEINMTADVAQWIVNECQLLVQRQREHLVEC